MLSKGQRMSRAFVKEDVEREERPRRTRSASGLPPGAINYMTAAGARRLRERLAALRKSASPDEEEAAHLESVLASATVLEPRHAFGEVVFGSRVTVQSPDGTVATYRIVGADEVDVYPDGVSWVSPLGRALLSTKTGDRLPLPLGVREGWRVISAEPG